MTQSKIYRTKDGAFEYGYVANAAELAGTMIPFRPHWWAQYLGDGTQSTFNTKREALEWIEGWKEIGR